MARFRQYVRPAGSGRFGDVARRGLGIDGFGQQMGQNGQDGGGGQAGLVHHGLDLLAAQQAAQFIGGDGQVVAVTDP